MATYVYPTSIELGLIAQRKLPNLVVNRPAFDILPIRNSDAAAVDWEQRDNYRGLQQLRGLNGPPIRVVRVGGKRYSMEPGAYGEFTLIDEIELTKRRTWGDVTGRPINIDDLVTDAQDQLLGRRLDRVEKIIWDLLIAGTFSVAGPGGAIIHTDSYTPQTASAAVSWATFATAKPLADLRAVQLLSRGYSVNFGATSTAYMNRVTSNLLLQNTNQTDLGGKRTSGLATVNSIGETNVILAGEDLPRIVIYDGGYQDDTDTFQPFIPNNKVLIVGLRTDGSRIGNYLMTRNANNPNLEPGPYVRVIDTGEDKIPREIQVHDGHNGGPTIEFPSALVVLST